MTSMNEILFPVQTSRILAGFTTSAMVNKPNVVYVDLSDKALGVHKVSSRTTHNLVTPPIMPYPSAEHNGITEAWEALYPEGSINPGNKEHPLGGFGFYLRGPPEFASILKQGASEVLLSYSMAFESDFAWALGGKLPGPYGGEGDSAYGCTGGRQTDRCRCFNLRLMWRKGGGGELYAYVPNLGKNMERLKEVPPKSVQHPDYGLSVGMGAFRFRSGEWVGIAQRVKLNTVGSDDGEIEVFVNGERVILATGLTLRESNESLVQGIHFQTFFGGHSPEWASPKAQKAWFSSVSGAILANECHGSNTFRHEDL